VSERAHPSKLREPGFGSPVVRRKREQIVRLILEHGARIAPEILDAVLAEPVLHFGNRVTVLFRMPVLIAQPGLAPRRFVRAVAQHRVEGHHAVPRQPRDHTAQPGRQTREGVVDTQHDHAAWPRQARQPGERRARVGRVMEDAGGVHDVERSRR